MVYVYLCLGVSCFIPILIYRTGILQESGIINRDPKKCGAHCKSQLQTGLKSLGHESIIVGLVLIICNSKESILLLF